MNCSNNFCLKIKSLYRRWQFNNKFSNVKYLWPFYDLKRIIINMIKYFGVIANDRPWDYQGWLTITDKKFELLEKNLRENGSHVNAERDADNIRKTRLALKRIIEDDYHDLSYRQHDAKWGGIEMRSEQVHIDEELGQMYEVHMDRDNAITDELKEQESKEFRRIIGRPDYLKKQDLEYVTGMINKYLFHWWD